MVKVGGGGPAMGGELKIEREREGGRKGRREVEVKCHTHSAGVKQGKSTPPHSPLPSLLPSIHPYLVYGPMVPSLGEREGGREGGKEGRRTSSTCTAISNGLGGRTSVVERRGREGSRGRRRHCPASKGRP